MIIEEAVTRREKVIQLWRVMKLALAQRMNAVTRTTTGCYYAMQKATTSCVEGVFARIGQSGATIEASNPLAVLKRGYARVLRDGQNITSAKEVQGGDKLDVRLYDGVIKTIVEGTDG
jgi:exonuclease VII large subunit